LKAKSLAFVGKGLAEYELPDPPEDKKFALFQNQGGKAGGSTGLQGKPTKFPL